MDDIYCSGEFKIFLVRHDVTTALAFCKCHTRLILKLRLAFTFWAMGDEPLRRSEFVFMVV